jgi:hypothetical protein
MPAHDQTVVVRLEFKSSSASTALYPRSSAALAQPADVKGRDRAAAHLKHAL